MNTDIDVLCGAIRKQLSPKRWAHTLGCAETARRLAAMLDANPDKAYLAGMLHDITREKTLSEQLIICSEYDIIIREYERDSTALLHAVTGAAVAKAEYDADDEICTAIACHTTGRVGMTPLDMALCLADYIEPTRDFPGVEALRKQAETDPALALLRAFDGTITHIISKNGMLHPDTVTARNDLLKRLHLGDLSDRNRTY